MRRALDAARMTGVALLAALVWPLAAGAEGLDGRTVLFNAASWDDPAAPYLVSSDYGGVVGEGPEFGMVRETGNGLGVVPVVIDVSAGRIDFTYPKVVEGQFAVAVFNGYLLRFPTDCVLIASAAIDRAVTTLPLKDSDLILTPQSLSLNVAGQDYGPETRIGVVLEVMDCPVS